ncbi:unnamed protein product [Scytosiphon promiscuus]
MGLRRLSRPTGLLAGLVTAWVISSRHNSAVGALSDSSSSSTPTSCTALFGAVRNGICDGNLNTEECGYDGGDCCSCTCVDDLGGSGSSGSLRGIISAHRGCGDAGFACIDPSAECMNDVDIESSTILNCVANNLGDGVCDDANNNAACGYDGGDCCVCTCTDGPVHQCGGTGYTCIDPDAHCVNDGDGDTSIGLSNNSTRSSVYDDSTWSWAYKYYDDTSLAGLYDNDDEDENEDSSSGTASCITDFYNDSDCDVTNNNEACGYDGGDCCPCTCTDTPGAYVRCGENGYACVDPDASCVDDNDATTLGIAYVE